ncbi:hypothetical protein CYMTET_36528, partial [Cymbomonas tetramitiformis]
GKSVSKPGGRRASIAPGMSTDVPETPSMKSRRSSLNESSLPLPSNKRKGESPSKGGFESKIPRGN